uniref:Lipoprotein n=1 Tax=viral metagenome TaxID=1070528 RepID=A0A6M3KGB8_9ZZZZ
MKIIIMLFSLLILAGCVRTYHVYNYVSEMSSLTQTIKVDAIAAHPITVDADVPVGP